MINRREILKIGGGLLLAAPLSAVKIPLQLLIDPDERAGDFDVIADTTSEDGRAFMSAARADATHAAPLTLDETGLISRLDAHWSAGSPRALFGLTQSSIAMLVEALARKHQMVLTFRGWHDGRPDGATHHSLYGQPAAIARLKADIVSAPKGWAPVLGRHAGELIMVSTQPGSENFQVSRGGRSNQSNPLISWAVAPIGSRASS